MLGPTKFNLLVTTNLLFSCVSFCFSCHLLYCRPLNLSMRNSIQILLISEQKLVKCFREKMTWMKLSRYTFLSDWNFMAYVFSCFFSDSTKSFFFGISYY